MAPYDPHGTEGRMEEMLPADCLSIQEIGTAGCLAARAALARRCLRARAAIWAQGIRGYSLARRAYPAVRAV
jgi:hypothetical protein